MNRRTLMQGAVACLALPAFANDVQAARIYPAIPVGYQLIGAQHGVPPIILYGVALQESSKLFGQYSLPYPWTLNVAGKAERHGSFIVAVNALRTHVGAGITSIDCGLMQVNWRYHAHQLGSMRRALDPYPNLAVGASILRSLFAQSRNWMTAVGQYHSPSNTARAQHYAAQVFNRIRQVQHA